jgi:hypothetical protein
MGIIKAMAILVAGYAGGFFTGSFFLRMILRMVNPRFKRKFIFHDTGVWSGLTEHFLIVTFVLMHEFTAIGLIFAAKEYVRSDKIKENPSYYLLGTLLSISFAILFGLLTRIALIKKVL